MHIVTKARQVATSGGRHVRRASAYAGRGVRRAALKGARLSARGAHTTARHSVRAYRRTHHVVAQVPHKKLTAKWSWYAAWHNHHHVQKIHVGGVGLYALVIIGVLFSSYRAVLAASDLIDTWNFNSPAGYTIDSGIELSGGTARLKAQNYTPDGNTSALYHLDESSGSTADDASANNNDATSSTPPTFGTGHLNNAASFNGTNNLLRANDSTSLSLNFANTLEAWTKLSGPLSSSSHNTRQTILDKGSYKLEYDNTTGKLNYEMADAGATTWTQVAGGNGINGGWTRCGKAIAGATVNDGTNLYVGLSGCGSDDAEVWRWNGTAWSQLGGDGVNSSWPAGDHERVRSLAIDGGKIYAGLGINTNDAEVWMYDSGSWTKIGGDGINSGWPAGYEEVMSMTVMGGNLYAGLGRNTNDARIYRWNGSSWDWVGGFGITGYTAFTTGYESIYSLTNDGTNVYAGMGENITDADVWRLNGTTWTQIGGDGTNSSWNTNYEQVMSMYYQGTTLYAGLGTTSGDAEVWAFASGSWTKLGGDGENSSWSATEGVYSLTGDGTNIYAGLGIHNIRTEVWRWNGSAWTQIGGDNLNGGSFTTVDVSNVASMTYFGGKLYAGLGDNAGMVWVFESGTWRAIGGQGANDSWGGYNATAVTSMVEWNGKLYAGHGQANLGTATVWEFDGSNWTQIGGTGTKNSWAVGTHHSVHTLTVYNGELYAGLGNGTADGEVWRYNGTTWTQIGGDNLNSGWNNTAETVQSLAVHNGDLYAGLGNAGTDGDIWRWNGSAWSQIGGDGINSSWNNVAEAVFTMVSHNGVLYAGNGSNGGDAEVWAYSGSTWTKIGGDGLSGSWADANFEEVRSMAVYNGELYAGIGVTAGDAEVWKYNGSTWSQVGGDGTNSSWDTSYEAVYSMAVYNGELYAGLGFNGGDGEAWKFNGSSWTKVGGDGINTGWDANVETVRSMATHKGKLYSGLGDTSNINSDVQVWSYGNNALLSSAATTQDTNWHHVAASYDGTTMRLYIDGALNASRTVSNLMPDNSLPLLVGANFGSNSAGETAGYFTGQLDEVRVSNVARGSFTTKPYVSTHQLITLNSPIRTSGVLQWDTFDTVEAPNGGTVQYRLSVDDGASWLFWNGAAWATSSGPVQSNSVTDIDAHMTTLPVTFNGLRWQAVLKGDGDQQVALTGIETTATSDVDAPDTNASNITALKANGGSALASNGWTNGASPVFNWTAATDSGSGIKGYCLYLGTDNTADVTVTKGMLGTSPVPGGANCQFVVGTNSIDLASPGFLNTPLATSNAPYYLRVVAIDNAGNLAAGVAQFQFRFDNVAPTNPAFINAPSGFLTDKTITMTWPTAGGNAAADANAGVAGLQYRIGSTTWYGDTHSGTGDAADLLTNDGSYTTQDPPDFDNLVDGVNTVYFRTWDQAGNISSGFATAALRINMSGAPSEPQNLQATPGTNTVNAFAFDWEAPEDFIGEESALTYCYTVNTLPSSGTCTFTSAGVSSLGAGPYATQPGTNTFYVVARDETNNINYASYTSTTFTANTPSPGIPTNIDAIDVSVKATNNWRIAVTWDVPTNVGAGVSSYRVYRSTDNVSFSQIGSSAGTTYVDTGLSQLRYYYKVRACDNTNNCGADSGVANELPTGRFTEPANLVAEPKVSDITTKKATISWSTDRHSDSRIALGTTSGSYSSSEVTVSDQVTAHKVALDNLSAGTTYYFIAKWTDDDGNTGQSQEYTFTTAPAPSLKEVKTVRVNLNSALIQFTSRQAVRASVVFGRTEAFGGIQSLNTSFAESTYNVELPGLEDGITYYYKIITYDAEGTAYDSSIFSFTTPARPRINNVRFQPVQGEPTSTQKVTWDTNVAASSMVTYGKLNTEGAQLMDTSLVTSHEIIIRGLEDDSEYFLIAESRDGNGNIAISDRQLFRTALDTRPPKVSDVTVESSIRGSGAEARGQIIVSWKTDELTTSQVSYTEGTDTKVFNNRTAEDDALATEHVVIISDLPTSRVFSLQPVARDQAGNQGTGSIETAIIGRATDSVLSIILNSLNKVFGF